VSGPLGLPRQIYGVDFSGAADAGRRIWITRGIIDGQVLHIQACYRAAELPGSGPNRERCLAALRDFIGRQGASAFGLDFPFGLPRDLVEQTTWEDFVVSFRDRYTSPEAFREVCRSVTDGAELKRATDRESHTPFSPYNIRLYRQTYYGIRDVLAPLVRDGLARVLPMQAAAPDQPWVLEICPASTLKREYLYRPYKGKSPEHGKARKHILEAVERTAPLSLPGSLRSMILEDTGGDALDSLLAAFSVCRALHGVTGAAPMRDKVYSLEGYVYV
jgi:hypothetical protein